MDKFSGTPEQLEAIAHPTSMVVTACPGSGKTAVISKKIRSITKALPQYKGVIAISFTNKASDELRKRCAAENQNVKASFFGTIDAFCITKIVAPFAKHIFDIKDGTKITISKFAQLSEQHKESSY
jgi:superfamily I DNA/RNA helicase